MERNADLVILEAYAPWLVNVNPSVYQWPTNLSGYDALRSYGSPSYYTQVMFDWLRGHVVLPATLTTSGGSPLYESVTRDTRNGTIYLKLVNMADQTQPLHVTLSGVSGGAPLGRAVVMTSANPQDTNTLDEPYKVVPRIMQVGGGGSSFDLELHPYSVTVLPIGGHGHDQP